jgi:hypothetical protein
VLHPIAAGNRLEGLDCQRWRVRHPVATAKLPLTGLSWRATSSEADEATGVRPGMADPASGQETGDGADARWMSRLIRCLAACTGPACAARASQGRAAALTPGRGGAQRSRLDIKAAGFGSSGLFVPKPTSRAYYQHYGTSDLGATVRQCPLTPTAGGGDCYSVGYSVAR